MRTNGIVNLPQWFSLSRKNTRSKAGRKSESRRKAILTLKRDTYAKLVERFRDDFELFGFPIPSYEQLLHDSSLDQ